MRLENGDRTQITRWRVRPAQIGLLIVTPLVIAVAVALHRQGALGFAGMVAVTIGAVTAAAVLFLSH
jgi:hypothetical protein